MRDEQGYSTLYPTHSLKVSRDTHWNHERGAITTRESVQKGEQHILAAKKLTSRQRLARLCTNRAFSSTPLEEPEVQLGLLSLNRYVSHSLYIGCSTGLENTLCQQFQSIDRSHDMCIAWIKLNSIWKMERYWWQRWIIPDILMRGLRLSAKEDRTDNIFRPIIF